MATKRQVWADAAKALAIILMVFGHLLQSLIPVGLVSDSGAFWYVNNGVYLFHMPLFFFVSGYFFSAQKLDSSTFFKRSLSRIAHPFAIWAILFISFKLVMGGSVNYKITYSEYWRILYNPLPPYWFLYTLFWIQVVGYLLLRKTNELILVLFTLGVFILHFLLPGGPLAIRAIPENLLFFTLGYVFARYNLFQSLPSTSRWYAIALFGAVEWLCNWGRVPFFAFSGRLCGAMLVLLLCTALYGFNEASALRATWVPSIGKNTLPIYCMHMIFMPFCRIVLLKAGVRSVTLHLLAGTLAGVAIPLVVLAILQKMNIAASMGFPEISASGRPKGAPSIG